MPRIYAFFILFMVSQALFSQESATSVFLDSEQQVTDIEKMMTQWSLDPDVLQKKGWKWLGRWSHDQLKNIGSDGLPPLYETVNQGYKQAKRLNKESSTLRNNEMWSPAGPSSSPSAIDDDLIEGTGRINCITFHPTDSNTIWVGGGQGGIFKSTNRGESWFAIGDNLPVMHVSDIAVDPIDPDVMYVCVGDYAYIATGLFLDNRKRHTHYGLGIYKTEDGGATWQTTGLSFEQSENDASLTRRVFIDPLNTDRLLAAGVQGIWTSEDAGDTWAQVIDQMIWDIERLDSAPNIIYASTGYLATLNQGEAGLMKSTDFGRTWSDLPSFLDKTNDATRLEIAIAPSAPNIIYVLAANRNGGLHGVYRSGDAGQSWTLQSDYPNILHWTTGEFSISGQGWYDLTILVDPNDSDKIYTGGVNTWISEDAGINWDGASYYFNFYGESVHADHHQLKISPHDDMIYLCHDGGVSRTKEIVPGNWADALSDTTDTYAWGTEWEHLNDGLANLSFYRLGLSQQTEGMILAGAQDMGVFLKDSARWTYHTLGDGMECVIDSRNDDHLFGSSQFGFMRRSYDRGQQFVIFDEQPWRDESTSWTTPFYQIEGQPDHFLIAGSNVYLSEDDAATFQPISQFESMNPISAMQYCKSNPDVIYVAKRMFFLGETPTEVHVTFNGGQEWSDITVGLPENIYFSYLEVDEDDPLHAWISCAGFDPQSKVFETLDGGSTWQNISYDLPNLPVNCVIQDPNSADGIVYVGTDRGIYYKRPNEVYWNSYSIGLPNVVVTEMEIHEATRKLYASTFGRGVWINDLAEDLQVSVNDSDANNFKATVYPSISNTGQHTLSIKSDSPKDIVMEVVDGMGRILERITTSISSIESTQEINIEGLSGHYFLRLHDGQKMQVFKLMKISD